MSSICTIKTYIETDNVFLANKFWKDESEIGVRSKAPLNYTNLNAKTLIKEREEIHVDKRLLSQGFQNTLVS